jgi:exocyst complex component 3
LCRECQTLIEHHDQIKLLSNARNNLNMTLKVNLQQCSFGMMVDLKFLEPCSHTSLALLFHLQDVEGMMSISTEAAEARASLEDEKELLHTFEVSY